MAQRSYLPLKFEDLEKGAANDPIKIIRTLVIELNKRFQPLYDNSTGRPAGVTQTALTFQNTTLTDVVDLGSGVWFDSTTPRAPTIPGFNGGYGGRVVIFKNGSLFTYTIPHECTSALPQQRVSTRTGAAISLSSGAALVMIYDDKQQRWRPIGTQL